MGGGEKRCLSPFLSFIPLFLSLCRRGERDSAAEAELAPRRSPCHCLDSCHANTPTAIIGALMGLSLTWERGSRRGTEASRGKECAQGDMQTSGETVEREAEPRKQEGNGSKDRRKKRKDKRGGGGGGMSRNTERERELSGI